MQCFTAFLSYCTGASHLAEQDVLWAMARNGDADLGVCLTAVGDDTRINVSEKGAQEEV